MKTQIAILALGLTTLGSVASAQTAQQLPPAVTTATPDNSLTVQNDRKVPVTVYMEYGQFDRRLGVVPAMQTATLALPAWAVRERASIELFAHPEGEVEDLETQEFSLRPPARIGMVIPSRGHMTSTPPDTMMEVIPPEELADATLTVDNPRSKPVTVFADMDPFDVRLGTVPAHSRVTLRFPKSVIYPDNSIRVFVHPEGGLDLSTETLQVRKGEHLGLRVPVH